MRMAFERGLSNSLEGTLTLWEEWLLQTILERNELLLPSGGCPCHRPCAGASPVRSTPGFSGDSGQRVCHICVSLRGHMFLRVWRYRENTPLGGNFRDKPHTTSHLVFILCPMQVLAWGWRFGGPPPFSFCAFGALPFGACVVLVFAPRPAQPPLAGTLFSHLPVPENLQATWSFFKASIRKSPVWRKPHHPSLQSKPPIRKLMGLTKGLVQRSFERGRG